MSVKVCPVLIKARGHRSLWDHGLPNQADILVSSPYRRATVFAA